MASVKSTRSYNSSGRREQARRTREAVLDTAQRLFLEEGYAATTIASIARGAGVSVETIYKAFGGKAGLVKEIYERGLGGRGSTPAYERSDAMREQESDPWTIMQKWGVLTAEVAAEVTPIRLLIRSAAIAEPAIALLLDEIDQERLERMHHHAKFLKERGYLREGVSLAEATDILWTCSSAELYELLVMKRGWPRRRFAGYVTDFMIATLLPAPAE
jgi:AcrR family transcriptional regulator